MSLPPIVQLSGCSYNSATWRLHMIRRKILLDAPREEVWEALTDPERLEDWFANGEERRAVVREVEPGERLAFDWEDEGEVEFTLADDGGATLLTVVETSPAWTTALDVQAFAF